MLLISLRRWLARRSAFGVLGLALGLTLILGGAQVAAVCHEIAHAGAAAKVRDLRATGHECPTCVLAAAIGGAATAPPALILHMPGATLAAPDTIANDFTPRFACVYASRAPPRARVLAA